MVAYRYAVAADADDVMKFWATAAEDAHRPPDSADAVLRLIASEPEALILAVDNTVVVGSIIVGWDGWRCHLYRLAVAPTHRRQGRPRTGRAGRGPIHGVRRDPRRRDGPRRQPPGPPRLVNRRVRTPARMVPLGQAAPLTHWCS